MTGHDANEEDQLAKEDTTRSDDRGPAGPEPSDKESGDQRRPCGIEVEGGDEKGELGVGSMELSV